MLNKEWIDDWMGRNDVVMRNEAYTEIVDALRAQADAQPVAWMWKRPEWVNWFFKEWGSDAFGEDADQYIRIPLYTHPAPEAAQALSDGEIDAIEALAMEELSAKTGVHVSELSTDTDANPEWRRAFARAILTRASAATTPHDPQWDDMSKPATMRSAATVAEPSKRASLTITLRQAERLVAFFGGHDCEVTIATDEMGLSAWCTEYPEEGADYLGPTVVDDELAANGRSQAAQQQAEPSAFRASVERMVTMLEEGEWAEHVAATTGKGDPLAQLLEDAITNLINEASGSTE